MIKLIVFDMLGVIIDYDRDAHLEYMSKKLERNRHDIQRAMTPLWEKMEIGNLSATEMRHLASRKLNVSQYKLNTVNNFKEAVKINHNVYNLMKELRSKYKVVILTNISNTINFIIS